MIEEILIKSDIPYQIVGGIKFYDRKEIKDMLAYLRLISNPDDDISLTRIINVPKEASATQPSRSWLQQPESGASRSSACWKSWTTSVLPGGRAMRWWASTT